MDLWRNWVVPLFNGRMSPDVNVRCSVRSVTPGRSGSPVISDARNSANRLSSNPDSSLNPQHVTGQPFAVRVLPSRADRPPRRLADFTGNDAKFSSGGGFTGSSPASNAYRRKRSSVKTHSAREKFTITPNVVRKSIPNLHGARVGNEHTRSERVLSRTDIGRRVSAK